MIPVCFIYVIRFNLVYLFDLFKEGPVFSISTETTLIKFSLFCYISSLCKTSFVHSQWQWAVCADNHKGLPKKITQRQISIIGLVATM